MQWNFKADRPIYAQLVEQIQLRIVSGQYPPGVRLPSVRELAAEASINPNTMQRALAELERHGLVYTQRTSGRFITEDQQLIESVRDNLAFEEIHEFLEQMRQLGYDTTETIAMLKKVSKEEF